VHKSVAWLHVYYLRLVQSLGGLVTYILVVNILSLYVFENYECRLTCVRKEWLYWLSLISVNWFS